jgi:hypothetical protein
MSTQHAVLIVEFAAIAMIGVGVWFVYWPAALIVAGALILVGAQGFNRLRAEDGE